MRRFEVSLLRCAVTPPALVEILGVDLLTSAFGTLTFVRGVAALIGSWWWWLWFCEAVLVGNIFQFLQIVVIPLQMSKWDKMYTNFFTQALLLLGSLLTPREVERSLSTSHLCHKHNHFHNWLKQWYQHQVAFYISTTLLAISAVICFTAWLVSVYIIIVIIIIIVFLNIIIIIPAIKIISCINIMIILTSYVLRLQHQACTEKVGKQ